MPLFSLLLAVSFALAGEQPATTIQVGVTVTVPTSMEMPDVPKEQALPVAVNGKFTIVQIDRGDLTVVSNVLRDSATLPLSACLGSFDLNIEGTFYVRGGTVNPDSLFLTYQIDPGDVVVSDDASACARAVIKGLHFPSTVGGTSVHFIYNHVILGD